jgi:hypothetical protein
LLFEPGIVSSKITTGRYLCNRCFPLFLAPILKQEWQQEILVFLSYLQKNNNWTNNKEKAIPPGMAFLLITINALIFFLQ